MSQSSPKTSSLLSQEAIRGTFWNYLTFGSGKLINLLTTLILARLLVPEQFGLVGYCTVAIQYLDIMNTAGINSALIARKEKVAEATNAAFIINIAMGIFSFGLSWVIAPFLASFFKAEEVTNLFRLLSVVLIIDGLGLVPDTLLMRNIRFRARLIPEISRNFAKGLTSIVLAYLGWGPWSLIWGQIAGELVAVIFAWILVDWRPALVFDWKVTKEIVGYGFHIIVTGFAGAIHYNVDYIIVGRILGSEALGLYTMAYRMPELAIRSINEVAARVMFPLLSRAQTDKESLRTFYFSYIRYISVFTFSIGFGLAIISRNFIEIFLTSNWTPTIIPMTFIAVALVIASVGHAPGILYKSINRPEILSRVTLVKLPIIIALLLFCSRWGINGMAAGQLVFAIFSVSLDSFVVSRVITFKLGELFNALAPAALSSGIMVLVLGSIQLIYKPSGWLGLVIILLTGVIVFIGALWFVSRETANQILLTFRKEVLRK